ncbi:unnamed protein product [Linum trigynum]|uniref:Uncharacterized protein n=1 Tax=Linum trigynum TaxID=586398 RepID=A0AAV2GYL2_9ROSI
MSADFSLNVALDTKRRFDAMMELEKAKLEEAYLSISSGNGGVPREEFGIIKLVDYSSSSSDESGVIKLVDYLSSEESD